MDEKEKFHTGKKLIELTEQIIFRVSPFDNFNWPKEVSYEVLEKYHIYKDDIDKNIKDKLVQYFKQNVKEQFSGLIGLSESRSFYDRYPDLIEARDEFYKWYKVREGTNYMAYITGYSEVYPKFDVNKLIKETIKERDPGYKIAKKKPIFGARSFYRKISNDNKLFIGFERGSLRTFMSFLIGFEKPWIGLDIGNLFLTGQSSFDFIYDKEYIGMVKGEKRRIIERLEPTPNNVVEVTTKALDLLEYLLPHIIDKLEII
ncbi:MAG: hypothetical protein ABIK92_12815 [Pseudomonadota bacterium]